ncbi:MAG: NAD(P)-dependent oxidoreductase [Akkermansiaceae bacterium]|nr:NAD(P)-dependent oxidoreductase [Armatimonadota bacterium]
MSNEQKTPPRVGFVGLGLMGYPMARNVARAGFPLTVYNRTRSKAEALAGEVSCVVADTPAAAAKSSDIVITMVSDVPDVEAVYLAPGTGIIHGVWGGMVCVDMGTVGVACVRNVAEKLAPHSIGFVDAPVSGGSWGAESGTLSIMAGGAKADFDRVYPVFETMGKKIVHCGESVGDGQKVKLVNQINIALSVEAVAEGLLFAVKTGANIPATLDAVGAGAAASWSWNNLGARMAGGDYAPGFKIEHLIKDLRLALQAADAVNLSLPGVRMVLGHYEKLCEARPDAGGLGTQALIEALK